MSKKKGVLVDVTVDDLVRINNELIEANATDRGVLSFHDNGLSESEKRSIRSEVRWRSKMIRAIQASYMKRKS